MTTQSGIRQRRWLTTGAALLGLLAAGAGTALAQQAPPAQQPPQRERLLTPEDRAAIGQVFWHRVQARLGLTDQQVADIRSVLEKRRDDSRKDFQALRESRRQLRTLLQQQNSDPKAIEAAATQVKAIQDKLFDQRLQTQLDIRGKLTAEQWQRWLEMRQGMGHRWARGSRGPGMGPGMGTM
jgi:Spy/CpxP family protein refolding chaperone